MIEFRDVHKDLGGKPVLKGVSFTVPTGGVVFLIGKSGMGKSVLLRHVVGLLKPDRGEVFVDEQAVSPLGEAELAPVRRRCGMVFQHPALLDSITVRDNVAFGVRAHRIAVREEDIGRRVEKALRTVGVSLSLLDRYPRELSSGVQKQVSLARSLAVEPKHLLFDEPTTGLDPQATAATNSLISRMARELKVTCLVVSHDMHCALEIADRIYLLDEGRVADAGTAAEMRRSSHEITRDFMRDVAARGMDELGG